MTLSEEQFLRIAKALADPRRCRILERIAGEGELSCQVLCDELPVAQPTVSHHLKALRSAGLIETRREGQRLHCRFRAEVARAYLAAVAERLAIGGGGPSAAAPPATRTRAITPPSRPRAARRPSPP